VDRFSAFSQVAELEGLELEACGSEACEPKACSCNRRVAAFAPRGRRAADLEPARSL